jgi:hypothetical protein
LDILFEDVEFKKNDEIDDNFELLLNDEDNFLLFFLILSCDNSSDTSLYKSSNILSLS